MYLHLEKRKPAFAGVFYKILVAGEGLEPPTRGL